MMYVIPPVDMYAHASTSVNIHHQRRSAESANNTNAILCSATRMVPSQHRVLCKVNVYDPKSIIHLTVLETPTKAGDSKHMYQSSQNEVPPTVPVPYHTVASTVVDCIFSTYLSADVIVEPAACQPAQGKKSELSDNTKMVRYIGRKVVTFPRQSLSWKILLSP
jgi:hypothetical protein